MYMRHCLRWHCMLGLFLRTVSCIVEFISHLLSDRDTTSSTGMGVGENGNKPMGMGIKLGKTWDREWEWTTGNGREWEWKTFPHPSTAGTTSSHCSYLIFLACNSSFCNLVILVFSLAGWANSITGQKLSVCVRVCVKLPSVHGTNQPLHVETCNPAYINLLILWCGQRSCKNEVSQT